VAPTAEYDVAFDLTSRGFEAYWTSLAGVVFVVIVCAGIAIKGPRSARVFAFFIGAVAAILVLTDTWFQHREYQSLRHSVDTGEYVELEGTVTNFTPDPWGADTPQVFVLSGHRFEVHAAGDTSAFRRTVSRGGPSLLGRCVRLRFVRDEFVNQDKIVWLGLRREGCADQHL